MVCAGYTSYCFLLIFLKERKDEWWVVLFLGLICWLGVATKLNLLPVLLLPLFILEWRMKCFKISNYLKPRKLLAKCGKHN
ncbi:MAG: hypothetical protein HQL25_01170 [Candidatus Omnitrophica bacterium]|nr:hypothetical protein [Candidatus Omnitrophota bacterium]